MTRAARRRNYANLGFPSLVRLIKYQLVSFYGFLRAGKNGWSARHPDAGARWPTPVVREAPGRECHFWAWQVSRGPCLVSFTALRAWGGRCFLACLNRLLLLFLWLLHLLLLCLLASSSDSFLCLLLPLLFFTG